MKRDQLDAARDQRGLIDMSCLEGLPKSVILASNAIYLYQLEDCRVIFKRYSFEKDVLSPEAFNEVLYARLAKKLGIYCGEYDFAFLGEQSGTVSYVIEGNIKTVYELLGENLPLLEYTRDGQNAYSVLCTLFERKYPRHASTLKKELLRLIGFDAILGHGDKNSTNMLIWEGDEEAHLFSVDGSHLWGRFFSLKKRGRELCSFLNSLKKEEQDLVLSVIEEIDAHTEIDSIVKEYPIYLEVSKWVKGAMLHTRETILQEKSNDMISDYFLYPKREIKTKSRRNP